MSPLHHPGLPLPEKFKEGLPGMLKGKLNSREQELTVCLAFEQITDIGHSPALFPSAGHALQVPQVIG